MSLLTKSKFQLIPTALKSFFFIIAIIVFGNLANIIKSNSHEEELIRVSC